MMSAPISQTDLHKEIVVEQHMVGQLVNGLGYTERPPEQFDRKLALDTEILIQFLKDTQPEDWQKLEDHYKGSAVDEVLRQLEKALKSRDNLDVIRNGLKMVPGIHFRFCFFKPASGLNQALFDLYNNNVLTVMRQVRYSQRNENAIDVVLFINGIPIATIEIKNSLTGQTFKHAQQQYRKDRPPANEPLLTFKRGALVHFALDERHVTMTTRLKNGSTYFLPFNRGNDGGAGNNDIKDEWPIAYLYQDQPEGKAVFGRDVWLNILDKFLHLQQEDGKEAMIFPRFQQLDAVRKLMAHASANGPGQNYLIQHSAGSGKSNTIGWTAHQAINLHDENDVSVFNAVIIVTDRTVLDKQLQKTVSAFQQTKGVVKNIDGTSKQLKEALEGGARIIISTIQKFGTKNLEILTGQNNKRFAVIIDEAHSSQSGKAAQSMTDALTREDADDEDKSAEDIILDYQKQRGPQPNISFMAFTATPRNVTLERFGSVASDGSPMPFHLYSMRQAIEEGFILDVLLNYMTYKAYYKLEKAIDDDPDLLGRKAQRKVARFASLHPTAIAQKIEVIVEHFRRHVAKELNGDAKAMIVTQSREHALRYYLALNKYIEEQGYTDVKALVAFSGDLDVDGQTWKEEQLNGFAPSELPKRFDGVKPDGSRYDDQYQVLIVAEKYQTGFDQPKLCAMYVDRKLNGLQAVQTLARLNRTMQGKEKTWILDFQNEMEEIKEAFRPFYEVSQIEERSDPNQVYELLQRIQAFAIIDESEVQSFASDFFKGNLSTQDRIRLEGLVRHAVGRFEQEDDEGKQEEFRQLLRSFTRFYSFISQILFLNDSDLEKYYAYASWLNRLLPNRQMPPEITIGEDMLKLAAFRVEKKEEGSASLEKGDTSLLQAISNFGANPYTEEEQKSLSEIIDSFNERHGTQFSDDDFIRFEAINNELLEDEDFAEMLRNNAPDVVKNAYSQAFLQAAIRVFQKDTEMRNIILTDKDAKDRAVQHFFNRALKAAQE